MVAACVEEGTHCCDITGETPWVRRRIDRHHDAAAAKGTRVVPCCGFDSVSSDLGAWWMGEAVRERLGQETRRVRAAFRPGGGGLNGGRWRACWRWRRTASWSGSRIRCS